MYDMEEQKQNTSEQNSSMEELKMEEDENKEISMEDDILGTQSLLMSESDEEFENKKSPQKKISPKASKRILDNNGDEVINKLLAQGNEDKKMQNRELSTLNDVDNKESNEEENTNKFNNEIKSNVKDQESDIFDSNQLKNDIKESIFNKESLFLSESDELKGDSTFKNKSVQKKIIHKRSKRILDSDDDDSVEKDLLATQASKEEKLTIKNRISTLIDSDSDVDNKETEDVEKAPSGKLNNETDSDVEVGKIAKDDLKISKLKEKTNKKIKNTLHKNESDANSDSQETSKKSKKKTKRNSKLQDNSENIEFKKTEKNISLVDSESSDTETEVNASDLEASAREANFEINSKEKEKKPKLVRASAKKAMDEMKAIQSEQQRLHREALISIPYHKPRKHTLDEFLKRRTIIQPQLDSSVVAAIQTKSLKMTAEELEEYAKLMEERAKEATEFFKSESENEEEMVFKDNEGVLDKPEETNEQNCANISKETLEVAEAHNELTETNHDGVQLTEEELTELLNVEEQMPQGKEEEQQRPTCSKVLITEVIELPKLDMQTVRMSPIKTHTPRSSLNIKQLLAEKNLSESPSLSGDPNKLIDLESGDLIDKKPTGMENLMKRLMSTVKSKKSKNSETCKILSVENGKLEMSTVNVSLSETKDVQKEAKPGAAYFELKKSLFSIIKKKRLEELNKKQEDELEYNKCLEDEDDDDCNNIEKSESDVMYLEEYEPDEKPKNKVVMVDEEENALVVEVDNDENENEVISSDEADEENKEDENDDNDDVDDEEESYDDENTDRLDKSQHKSRIIKAFEDTDEEEGENDDIDFLKTQTPTMHQSLLETQASEKTSIEDEESELMALCSGTFDKTQKTSVNALMSQIPLTQNGGKPGSEEELMKLCSGTFDQTSETTQQQAQFEKSSENIKTICKKILSSDEENDEEQLDSNQNNKQRIKKLTKKVNKRKTKLGFSDDEDEDEEESEYEEDEENYEEDDQNVEELNENNEMDTEEPETFIDYDSEENEILVQMTKKDKLKQAQNFVEKEAELSESEWGSADEDENNLDRYDIELGDEDEFDKEKIRTELGQIHARKMLDEDIRAVRKIQEMLFEDEETDGVGRQRTFKWKNAESGFNLDDGRLLDETGDGQNGDSGDEMNEHQWRKIRYEREQFLKEQGLKLDSQDVSTVLNNTALQFTSTTKNAMATKKIQIIAAKKNVFSTSDSKIASPFLISKGISTMHKKSVRGSFLARDREILNKLAGITKGTSSSITATEMDDTAGTVSIKSIKPKNFVFATLTEEEHENLKRKADDLLNSSNENGIDFMKKPKIEPRRNKCFIDQLL